MSMYDDDKWWKEETWWNNNRGAIIFWSWLIIISLICVFPWAVGFTKILIWIF